MFLGVFADEQHLSYMAFALYMTGGMKISLHLPRSSQVIKKLTT
jgi:hypothetical protein